MNAYLKYYLPVFLIVYLLVTFVVPSIRVYRSTRINPVTFGKRDNAHDYIGLVMKIITGLLFITVIVFSISADAYRYLNSFDYLEQDWLKWIGLLSIHASLIWIVIAQSNMKQSWRIGIDEKHNTALVTKGLFRISRNPVFLGMIISTIGIFLIIPNALSFFIAATSYIIIQIQIRLEEEHLVKQHGTDYSTYKRRVRRLL